MQFHGRTNDTPLLAAGFVYCDDLMSIPKSLLTDYVGTLSDEKMEEVNAALRIALAVG